jgi:hypothetical protein
MWHGVRGPGWRLGGERDGTGVGAVAPPEIETTGGEGCAVNEQGLDLGTGVELNRGWHRVGCKGGRLVLRQNRRVQKPPA